MLKPENEFSVSIYTAKKKKRVKFNVLVLGVFMHKLRYKFGVQLELEIDVQYSKKFRTILHQNNNNLLLFVNVKVFRFQ